MELVTWVMEELKSEQETGRHSEISHSRKPKGPRRWGLPSGATAVAACAEEAGALSRHSLEARSGERDHGFPSSCFRRCQWPNPGRGRKRSLRGQRPAGEDGTGTEGKRTRALTTYVPDAVLGSFQEEPSCS